MPTDDLNLPPVLHRVDWRGTVGWPDPDHSQWRRYKAHYSDARDAARKVDEIAAHPEHLQLLGVHRGYVSWFSEDPDGLPRYETHEVTA